MTITIVNHEARATRGPGLHLVPSQETERHQAIEVPAIWTKPTLIERAVEYYFSRRWPAWALLIAASIFFGAAIVAATMGWSVR